MKQLTSQTLAQIVTNDHRAASVFRKYGLDFCCKGKRSLAEACTEQNITVDELMKELENICSEKNTNAASFDRLSLTELADHIVSKHHSYVKNEAPQLLAYLEKVASKHGDRNPELRQISQLFAAVTEEMQEHMKKEEVILFPRIAKLEKMSADKNLHSQMTISYLQAPIFMMESEHDHAGTMMAEIRELTNNFTPPANACTTYKLSFAGLQAFEGDLHEHVHLENNILFPKALKLFEQPDQCSLN